MPANGQYPFPSELYYDRATHLWARPEGPAVTIGLDALGLESLGDMAHVALHPAGTRVRRGEAIGSLEAAKMVGDLVAPLSGVIAARNEDVLRDPDLVNRDPYGAGWLARITPADWARDAAELVHGGDVAPWVAAEVERYRSQGWID